MKLTIKKPAVIKKFLVQGRLESYQPDKALSNVLKRIDKDGFEKLDVPDAFRQGLKFYLENNDYLYNNKLTVEGHNIADTGCLWKSLEGRFVISVLYCEGRQYLWSCSTLVDDYRDKVLDEVTDSINLPDTYIIDGREYRDFDFGRIRKLIDSQNVSVKITYSFSDHSARYECDQKRIENIDSFTLITEADANHMLSDLIKKYDFLDSEDGVLKCHRIPGPVNEALFKNMLIRKNCRLDPIEKDGIKLDDITFGISSPNVVDSLFCKYIMLCSENDYCPKHYLPSLFSEFSSIFDEVCDRGKDFGALFTKALNESKGKAHLRLQACVDLDPHIETNDLSIKDLSGQSLSANDLAGMILKNTHDVKSVSCISKFISVNSKIARNTILLADAIMSICGKPLTVVTCSSLRHQSEQQKGSFEKVRRSNNIILKNIDEANLQTIHDRYYRIVMQDDVKWIKMTGELDSLNYKTESPNKSTVCNVKELTAVWVDDRSIPEFVKMYMGGIE